MFQVLVGMEELGEFPKFTDAFKLFWSKIVEQMNRGTTLQWLETSNFLVYKEENIQQPMVFYDARDFAYSIGLLSGKGELQEGAEEPTTEVIKIAFAGVTAANLGAMLHEFSNILAGINQNPV